MSNKQVLVAAGVIFNPKGELLIAKRSNHQHQGGLWEFPGGKIETGETAQHALARELFEEVGISVSASEPLIRIAHDYADKSVVLDVWVITAFEGTAQGKEGQEVRWIDPQEMDQFDFPAANASIVSAIKQRLAEQA